MSRPDLRNAVAVWRKPAKCVMCNEPTYMLYRGARLPDAPLMDEMNIVIRSPEGRERGRYTVLPPYSRETYEVYACSSCKFWMLKNPS
jgi:hypothetical protein